MAKSPAAILYDSNGQALAVEDGVAIPAGTQALLTAGSDGTDAKVLLVDEDGRPVVVGAGTPGTPAGGVVTVQGDSSGSPIPVVGSFGLPTGAATEATLATRLTEATFTSRIGTLGQKAMAASTPVVFASDQSTLTIGGSVTVSNFPGTQTVSASALPLPSGAATDATLGTRASETTLSALNTKVQSGTIKTDGSATTQPVSGSVSVSNFPATQPVSASSLPLPTGAATAAKQPALGTAGTPSVDVLTVQGAASMTALKVDGSATTQPVSGSVSVSNFPATQAVSAAALPLPTGAATETTLAALNTKTPTVGQKTSAASSPVVIASDQSSIPVAATISGTPNVAVSNFPATQPVSAGALPLPTGAATSANQTTGNSSLSSIDGKVPALGQAAMVASLPVAIASNQSAVPVSGSVSVSNFPATQPVSAASLPLPTGAAADATLTGGTQKAIARGGAKGSSTASDVTSTASGANHQALDVVIYDTAGNAITSFGGSGSQGSPNTTANAWPTKITDGTNTANVKAASTAAVAADPALVVAVSPNNTVAVTGSVSVSNLPATQPVSAAALPLPTGAATETTLSGLATKVPTQGQKASAASMPVVLASDQSSVPVAATIQGTPSVSVSNFPATQPVSAASLPLPTGAATSAAQTTGNGSLSSIDTKVTGLSLDATLTGGSQKAIVRGGAKGSTVAADVTSIPAGTNQQALAVAVVDASGNQITTFGSGTVSVSNFPATQAVSALSLPLPTGASTAAKQPALGTAGTAASDVLTVQGIASMTALKVDGSAVTQPVSGTVSVSNFPATQPVSGTVSVSNFPGTQPVSAASLPLPTGAATAAKQPALGAAGTPSSDVLTVQGAVAMTALKVDGSAVTQPVSGTVAVSNLPATQAVSAAALPLPSGAATSAHQGTGNTLIGNIDTKTPALVSGRVPVDGSAVTQPVSAASLPLPSGASTAAKQPALGTAGAASIDVLTVQGIASMTALKVDGSAVTQPVSGTVTANIGTSSLALDATLTGGTQKAILRGGAKGSTTAADVTSLATGANHQALVVALVDALGNQLTNFGPNVSTTSAVTSVAGSAASVQLLAANTAREGATIYNDSTAILYVKLGTTASLTSFTVKVLSNGYYEVPFGYTGRIDGIWASATGSARLTELS